MIALMFLSFLLMSRISVNPRSRHRRSALVPDFSVICIVRVVHAVDIAGSDVNLTAPRAVGPLHLYQ